MKIIYNITSQWRTKCGPTITPNHKMAWAILLFRADIPQYDSLRSSQQRTTTQALHEAEDHQFPDSVGITRKEMNIS
jgi:hypothetical protein